MSRNGNNLIVIGSNAIVYNIIILVSLADGQGGSLESFGEIVAANENQPKGVITILADKDKVEMEEEIRDRVGKTGARRLAANDFGFGGIEPAAESDNLDSHLFTRIGSRGS